MESMPTISRRSFLAAGAALGTMAADERRFRAHRG